MRQVEPHYLRGAAKTWTPPVVVTFDTETRWEAAGDDEVHRLRCWCARRRLRRPGRGDWPYTLDAHGETALDLAKFVEAAAELDSEVWVFAHNLAFDLTVSGLPFLLAELGWWVADVHLGEESCWWSLRKDGRRLMLTDSWSWVRCSLDQVAKDMGRRKVPLPDNDAPIGEWVKRCKKDVDLLDGCMETVMTWWEENDLGRFGVTGSGCGWASMRRAIPRRSLVVGPDPDRTPFERRALFGGRQEAYRTGQVSGVWSADYDMADAYLTTTLNNRLPTRCVGYLSVIPERFATSDVGPEDVIAEVEITTDRPVAPCRIGDEIWWPTGTFRTVLTGPEIRYVVSTGAKVTMRGGYLYRVDVTLADWAWWCLGVEHNRDGSTPPIVRRIAKGWARSVVGRFAARSSRVAHERPAEHLGWHLVTGNDLQTGAHLDVLTLGSVERTIIKDTEPDDGFPAITAFVEGITRANLGRILDSRDPRRLIQANTDGWWESRVVSTTAYVPECPVEGVRIVRKRLERTVTVLGPNHLRSASERRFAGVPRGARAIGDTEFTWHDWPSMRWQMENGTAGTFTRPKRTVTIAPGYVRRWCLADGETIAATAYLDPAGSNRLRPWSQTAGRMAGDELAPFQIEALARLTDTMPPLFLAAYDGTPKVPGRFRVRGTRSRSTPLARYA